MEKFVFKMYFNLGMEVEYKKCYDEIWLELVMFLKDVGIWDYLIYFDWDINILFGVLWCEDGYSMDDLFVYLVM